MSILLLSIHDLVKHYGPEPVLDGVTFEIRAGERIGLVGPNGVGKTTLMRIVAGDEEADSGTIERSSTTAIGYLAQQPEFPPGRTLWQEAHTALDRFVEMVREAEATATALAHSRDAREHVRLAARYDFLQHEVQRHDAYHLEHRVERVLDGLQFARTSYEQPVEQLSGGQQNRLLLAKLLLSEPEIMLLDEPSNHLDLDATAWLEEFLIHSPAAVLVVSHDRYFLDRVTNRTLELFRGTVDSYPGNFSAYWRQKAERVEVERRTFDKQQEFIAKTEDFIRRNHYGQKASQAEDRRKKLERVERVAAPREIIAPPMGFAPADRCSEVVLRVEQLAKGFDRRLFSDLTFQIQQGQRWGILGPNGTGKTTLLRCLVGEIEPDEGRVMLGSGVKIGYYDQLLSGIDEQRPIVEAIRPTHKEFVEQQRRDLLARFGLRGDQVFQPAVSLSGGERSRAALARLVATDPNFLILDEPTNHLDLWARDALERSIREFGGTVIFVSHDRYFVNRVADHLLVVEPGRFRVIEGNYETYLYIEQQRRRDASAVPGNHEPAAVKPASKSAKGESKPAKSKRRYSQHKIEELESAIFQSEFRIEELHTQLSEPEILRDGPRVKAIQAEITEQKASLAALYEQWEEAHAAD